MDKLKQQRVRAVTGRGTAADDDETAVPTVCGVESGSGSEEAMAAANEGLSRVLSKVQDLKS